MKKIEVRCANCNRKLFIGSPGFNIKNGESRTIEIKCPRCNHINIINCEIEEKVVVRIKE
jgi:phage FluMu protein Com